jgi:hypothetical protein
MTLIINQESVLFNSSRYTFIVYVVAVFVVIIVVVVVFFLNIN